MVILDSWLLRLEYEPSSDILYARLPSVAEYGAAELRHALALVADHVVSYDVRNLLLDSGQVNVSLMGDGEYRDTIGGFLLRLTRTRLRRFARLNGAQDSGEARAVEAVTQAFRSQGSEIEFSAFSDQAAALGWLHARVPTPRSQGSSILSR